MTQQTMTASEARKVLSVFSDNHLRCGESLPALNIAAYLAHDEFHRDDVEAGLALGEAQGWFIREPDNTVTLTQAGFAAI